MQLLRPFAACVAALLLSTGLVIADDRLTVSYAATDDGSCEQTLQTFAAAWDHESPGMDVHANVTTKPSGADCRKESLSYSVAASRFFDLPFSRSVDAMARFGASRTSGSGVYAVTDEAGNVILRADGGAAHLITLRAGSFEAVTGTFGMSWQATRLLRLDAGLNFVPVDWADGSTGRTVHLGAHLDFLVLGGEFELAATADVGNEAWGQVRADWRTPVAGGLSLALSAVHDRGLDTLKSDAPMHQEFLGRTVVLDAPPAGEATTFTVGLAIDF